MTKLRLYQLTDESFYIDGVEYKLVAKGEINRPAKIKNVETDEVIDYGFAEWVDLENQLKILEDEIKEIPEEEQWYGDDSRVVLPSLKIIKEGLGITEEKGETPFETPTKEEDDEV